MINPLRLASPKQLSRAIATGLLLAASLGGTAQASLVNFAGFSQANADKGFIFTNNSSPASGDFYTQSGGVQVNFNYQSVPVPLALQGPQAATLTITNLTNVPGTKAHTATLGTSVTVFSTVYDVQPIDSTWVIHITRNTPYLGQSNLLTAVIGPGTANPNLFGQDATSNVGLSADTVSGNNLVTFTSDFLSFSGALRESLGLSLTGMTGNDLGLAANKFLDSFKANGTGSFASDPVPTPEPSSLMLLGLGSLGLLAIARRRRSA